MENRKSLILHFDSLDVIDELTKEQIAELFIAIRDYNLGKEIKLDGLMKAVFIPFKNQFDRDIEKYNSICERNRNNGKKGGRPKETKENPMGYLETEENQKEPKKAYSKNDSNSDNDNKKDSNNKYIISKEITKQSFELEKIDNRKEDINEMQDIIKQKVLSLGLIYKAGGQERNRIQNILTGKDFGMICEKANMSRIDFVLNIIELSTKLEFWKGKIYNAETLYKHYASVYNEAVRIKSERKKIKGCFI